MNSIKALQDKINALEQLLDVQEKSIIEQTDKLVESEARFRTIFEGSSDALMLLTDKGFLDCNPATLEMFGLASKEEFSQVHPADISPPRQPDGTESLLAAREQIKKAFENGANRFEWVHCRKGGKDFFAEVLLTAFDMNGKRVLQATVRDISKRKKAEQELQQREATIRGIYMAAPVGISVAQNRKMLTINRQISEISGYAEEELMGKSAKIFFIDNVEFERAGRELYTNLRLKGRSSVEARWKRKNGIQIDVLLTASLIDGTGHEIITVMDITERKQAELALRKNEAMLRGIYFAAPVGITVSKNRITQSVNAWLNEISGYSAEELIGTSARIYFPDDAEFERVGRELYESRAQGTRGNIEARLRKKDGTLINALLSISALDPADPGAGDVVTALDITERKRAEEALRQSEEKFKILFEQAADIILLMEITPEGMPVIREANSATFKLLGYERDELLGRPVSFINAEPDDFNTVHKNRQIVLSGTGKIFEAKHRCKDGTVLDFECSATEMQAGSKTFAVTVERDITKRKQAEKALAESENSFRSMFEASSDALNLVCIEDGRFLEVNNSMCLMFGYSREELLTMSPRDLINAENIPEQNGVLSAVLERGSAISDKGTVVRKKDGSMVQALVAAQIITWKGKRVIYSSLRDITPLKRIQDQLEQKSKETLEFTDTVTHDLKKPLTTMNIVLGLAKKNAFGILNPDGVDAIDTGIEASHYMQEMLDDLLACARLESGTQKLVIEETRLGEMVEAVLTRMKYQIEEKKIQIVPPDNDISVMADRKQLTRVLMNLIGNAINYIGSGTDKFIRIAWEQKNGAPVFMVADNGIGVPEASRKDLFAKFKRGSNVSGVQGTGLGLSIVKGIVEAHGGKIWFESEVDKGTTFYFTLIGKEMKS